MWTRNRSWRGFFVKENPHGATLGQNSWLKICSKPNIPAELALRLYCVEAHSAIQPASGSRSRLALQENTQTRYPEAGFPVSELVAATGTISGSPQCV